MKGKMRYIYNAGLLLLLLCSSCTERTLETRPDPVPIRLYTGIRTRAAVDAFDATPVCIACGSSSGVYAQVWDGVATAVKSFSPLYVIIPKTVLRSIFADIILLCLWRPMVRWRIL